jgi:hypothetical protein
MISDIGSPMIWIWTLVGYTIVAIHLEFGLDFGFHHIAWHFSLNCSTTPLSSYPLHSERRHATNRGETAEHRDQHLAVWSNNQQTGITHIAAVFISISYFLEAFAGPNLKKHVWGLSETSSEAYFIRIPQGG